MRVEIVHEGTRKPVVNHSRKSAKALMDWTMHEILISRFTTFLLIILGTHAIVCQREDNKVVEDRSQIENAGLAHAMVQSANQRHVK